MALITVGALMTSCILALLWWLAVDPTNYQDEPLQCDLCGCDVGEDDDGQVTADTVLCAHCLHLLSGK